MRLLITFVLRLSFALAQAAPEQSASLKVITVPAGTFDTFKVEVTSADGGPDKQTVWIAKDSRKPVKAISVLADMGGAIVTEELQ